MNNGTTQYTASFHYNILVRAGMSLPAFLLLEIILLIKFLYYIPDESKYKRKTEWADFILKRKNPVWEFPHRI